MSSHASAVPRQASVACTGAVADVPAQAGLARTINHRSPVPPPGHHPVLGHAWPLRDGIELSPVPAAVRRARLHSRHVLRDWGLSGLSGDAELLVSELTTNAIAAVQSITLPAITPPAITTTLPVRMWLLADTERVLVLVWDPSSRPPVLADSGQDAENGRGLQIVQAISQRWDWYRPRDTTGKMVWALAAL